MKTSESTKHLFSALFKAIGEMESATKSASNPHFRSKYADLNSILDATEDPFRKYGLLLLQPVCRAPDGQVFVESRVIHVESGEWVASEMPLFMVKMDMQAAGSAITYSRRYTLQSLPGMRTEDDDGNAAVGNPSPKEQTKIQIEKPAPVAAKPTNGGFKPPVKATIPEPKAPAPAKPTTEDDGWG